MSKLYYDAHAKNVIVKCKENRDLESLIENGEIGGNAKPDLSDAIKIVFLSTVPNMETIQNTVYTYEPIGEIELYISDKLMTFYMYFRNVAENENIPIGTCVLGDFYNIATVSVLGGTWEYLGAMVLNQDGVDKRYHLYRKTE